MSHEGNDVFYSSALAGGWCALQLLLCLAIIVKSTGADIYIKCPFIVNVLKKRSEVHIIKSCRVEVDEAGERVTAHMARSKKKSESAHKEAEIISLVNSTPVILSLGGFDVRVIA